MDGLSVPLTLIHRGFRPGVVADALQDRVHIYITTTSTAALTSEAPGLKPSNEAPLR
jgi:hypothetical protein